MRIQQQGGLCKKKIISNKNKLKNRVHFNQTERLYVLTYFSTYYKTPLKITMVWHFFFDIEHLVTQAMHFNFGGISYNSLIILENYLF
jgi:hypothetical protein